VNYWLPLIPGAIAYLQLRLHRAGHHDQPRPPDTGKPHRLSEKPDRQ